MVTDPVSLPSRAALTQAVLKDEQKISDLAVADREKRFRGQE